jgi:hypothetical protein
MTSRLHPATRKHITPSILTSCIHTTTTRIMHDDYSYVHKTSKHFNTLTSSHTSMFKSSILTTSRLLRTTKPINISLARPFTSSASQRANMDAYKKLGNRKDAPPAHKMVHFKGLLSEKRSFGDFRTVLHTGLFSQLVAMEVPVGGDIGDEVRLLLPRFTLR